MSHVVQFSTVDAIREQASLWMVRLQEGLRPEQEQQLDEWLAENPVHLKQLLELAELWDEMEVLRELKPLFEGVHSKGLRAEPQQTKFPSLRPWLAAAGIAIFTGVGLLLAPELNDPSQRAVSVTEPEIQKANAVKAHKYTSSVGEFIEVPLSDGSLVTLNSDTEISVAYTDDARDIILHKGEAHFDVSKDPRRPLSVLAAGKKVEAVGTAFSVKKNDDSVVVAVNEGKVAVYVAALQERQQLPAAMDSLRAGDVLTITDDTKDVARYDEAQMEDRLAWRKGMIVINDETLDFVISEFENYSRKKILLADKNMAEIRVAGYFRLGDVDALLVALEQNFGIASVYYQQDDIFVLSQRQ